MSDDDTTQPIPAEQPTTVEPQRTEPLTGTPAGAAATGPGAGTAAAPPTTPTPTVQPDAGHIRVTGLPAEQAQRAPRAGLRVGTVVWGLVIVAVGVGLLSAAWGAHVDAELALIVLLGAAGVALLVGSLVGMRRSRDRMEGRA